MDNNINEQENVSYDFETEKKKSKLPIIIILLIVVAGIGFGCWYFLFNKDSKKEEPKKEEQETKKEEVFETEKINNALDEYNNLTKNGLKFTLYCGENECETNKDDLMTDNPKVINQTCIGTTIKERYPGQREKNQEYYRNRKTDKPVGPYNYTAITDSGYIVLYNDNFAYKCTNKDCLYINHEQGKLFVYDEKIYIIDIKNETRTALDLTFKDVFEGKKDEYFYDDGHISFVITGEKKEGNSVINEYSDHLLEYTASDGGVAAATYFYDLNTNKKTKTYYYEYNYVELNGKKYIFGGSVFTEPGYAGIIDADTLEEVKSYNDANTIVLDEKNQQILVAIYQGERETFEDTYKVIHRLNYNLEEIK